MINFVGIMIGFALRRRGARPHSVVAMMMTTTIICALPLLLVSKSLALTAALLGCMCATMYGLNTMLTGLIPFEYHRIGKTGMTAGLVDSFIYAGSALAGALAGGVYEGFGVSALVVLWIAAAAVSIVMMRVSGRMSAAYWKKYD
jgi:sugar phosphate permease